MKTIVLGDIHGRNVWKDIVFQEEADRVIFMDEGRIVEDCSKDEFFAHPENRKPRTREFLEKILTH